MSDTDSLFGFSSPKVEAKIEANIKGPPEEPKLPLVILGLHQGQHRVSNMKVFIASRRGHYAHSRSTKKSLMETLHEIEQSVSSYEKDIISKWFRKYRDAERQNLPLPSVSRIEEKLARKKKKRQTLTKDKAAVSKSQKHASDAKRRARTERTNVLVKRELDFYQSPPTSRHMSIKTESDYDQSPPKSRRKFSWMSSPQTSHGAQQHLPPVSKNTEKDCSICLESLPIRDFPDATLSDACIHDQSACNECITTSVNTQIPDISWDQIKCPECPAILHYNTVNRYSSTESFQIYDRKALRSAYGSIPNFAMCLNPGCVSGQIHDRGDDEPIMTCKDCNFKMCFVHKLPWHEGKTCAEYDAERGEEIRSQEAASRQVIAETATICPNIKCGIPIQKNGGCDHMTCRACRHQFCFVCGAPWINIVRQSNTGHAENCRYHTNNIVAPRLVMPATPPRVITGLPLPYLDYDSDDDLM